VGRGGGSGGGRGGGVGVCSSGSGAASHGSTALSKCVLSSHTAADVAAWSTPFRACRHTDSTTRGKRSNVWAMSAGSDSRRCPDDAAWSASLVRCSCTSLRRLSAWALQLRHVCGQEMHWQAGSKLQQTRTAGYLISRSTSRSTVGTALSTSL
jgi:hypothetical protein